MVEGQRKRPVAGIDDPRLLGVVARFGSPLGPGHEDRRNGVETGVPGGVGVGPQLADELDLERGLLAGLPDGGLLEGFAVLDEPAGQGPAGRRVAPLDQDDTTDPTAVHGLDDDVHGGQGVSESGSPHRFLLGRPERRPFIVGGPVRACQFFWTPTVLRRGQERLSLAGSTVRDERAREGAEGRGGGPHSGYPPQRTV